MRTVRYPNWHRRGLSLLWNADALSQIANLNEVVSIRELVRLSGNWPDPLPSSNGKTLVVAGLEACLDALDPTDAKSWIDVTLKRVILDFQDYHEGQAGLVLWIAGGDRRIKPDTLGDSYLWRCAAPNNQVTLPIGRILFSGAERDVGRILAVDATEGEAADPNGPHWIGLQQTRIS